MSHRIAIVAHEDRHDAAMTLADRVQASLIAMDTAELSLGFKNHVNAWRWLSEHNDREWSVVLEDDALPVEDLNPQMLRALEVAPSAVVSLYLGREYPRRTQERAALATASSECWITDDRLHHAVGVAIRTDRLPDLLADLPRLLEIMPIDEAIGSWAKRQATLVSYTNPSLVDHDWHLPSIASPRPDEGERRAWVVGSRDHWDGSAVPL